MRNGRPSQPTCADPTDRLHLDADSSSARTRHPRWRTFAPHEWPNRAVQVHAANTGRTGGTAPSDHRQLSTLIAVVKAVVPTKILTYHVIDNRCTRPAWPQVPTSRRGARVTRRASVAHRGGRRRRYRVTTRRLCSFQKHQSDGHLGKCVAKWISGCPAIHPLEGTVGSLC
jgi:hypothetical protein